MSNHSEEGVGCRQPTEPSVDSDHLHCMSCGLCHQLSSAGKKVKVGQSLSKKSKLTASHTKARIRCLEGERDHDVGQQNRTMSCSRVGKEGGRLCGGGFRGSSTCPLAADGGEKCRTIYICIGFLRAVVVVLVVSVIISIHLWWSSSLCVCMLNRCFRRYSQVF